MRLFSTAAGCVGLCCCAIALAQVDSAPKFEIASIRRSAPDSETFMKAHPGGRLEISRATLRALTALAYRVQPFQVSGGPSWARSEHFNLVTKATDTPTESRLFLMMQALLAERFSLELHFETKEQPVYVLVMAKIGKRAPPGLQVTTEGSCVKADVAAPPDSKACRSLGMGLNHLEAQEISMSRLAEALSQALDRKVIDRTGRAESFNVSLRWTPDEHQAIESSDAISLPPDTPAFLPRYRNSSASGSNRAKLLSTFSSSIGQRDRAKISRLSTRPILSRRVLFRTGLVRLQSLLASPAMHRVGTEERNSEPCNPEHPKTSSCGNSHELYSIPQTERTH